MKYVDEIKFDQIICNYKFWQTWSRMLVVYLQIIQENGVENEVGRCRKFELCQTRLQDTW